MGRPRKRRGNNLTEKKDRATEHISSPPILEPRPYIDGILPTDSYFEGTGLLSGPGKSALTLDYGSRGRVEATGENHRVLWHDGLKNLNMPMDFGAKGPSIPQPCLPEEPLVPCNIVQGGNAQLDAPPPPCSCLATMYLALSSLQELPPEVGLALAAIRAALNTAQAVLRCAQCGRCEATPNKSLIEAFQNTMLLGTLLPVIVNCYQRLLEMVEYEANMAKAGGYLMGCKIFRDSSIRSELYADAQYLENALMEPDDWRAAVHRLLRADVYGYEMVTPGLRGIISEMELRQRSRHTKMDALGHSSFSNVFQQRRCLGERDAPCLRILNVTKVAMESLAIG